MWFKNTRTGLTWLVEDEKQIKELQKNDLFEEIDKPTKDTSDSKGDFVCDICGQEAKNQRSLTQHRRMAHGIDKNGNKVDTKRYNAKFNNNNNPPKDKDESKEEGEE